MLTQSYGEAGALERFGRSRLPIVSGHNSLWFYQRPSPATASVIAVGYPTSALTAWFSQCRTVRTLHTPYGLDNQEDGAEVSVCVGIRYPWSALWPKMRHYD